MNKIMDSKYHRWSEKRKKGGGNPLKPSLKDTLLCIFYHWHILQNCLIKDDRMDGSTHCHTCFIVSGTG